MDNELVTEFDPRAAIAATVLVVCGALFAVTTKLGMTLVLLGVAGVYFSAGGSARGAFLHLRRLIFFLMLIVAINGVLGPS